MPRSGRTPPPPLTLWEIIIIIKASYFPTFPFSNSVALQMHLRNCIYAPNFVPNLGSQGGVVRPLRGMLIKTSPSQNVGTVS
jgi:hypothetical protein